MVALCSRPRTDGAVRVRPPGAWKRPARSHPYSPSVAPRGRPSTVGLSTGSDGTRPLAVVTASMLLGTGLSLAYRGAAAGLAAAKGHARRMSDAGALDQARAGTAHAALVCQQAPTGCRTAAASGGRPLRYGVR